MKNKEIEEILNYMKQYVENKYEHDSEPMLNYKDLQIVLSYIEQLENLCNKYEQEHKTTFEIWKKDIKKLEQLENNRDKAIEVINTQLKNAEGGLKDNLRIIKFNLIKGSCTFEDLKTEEDYKYVLKGDSDYE